MQSSPSGILRHDHRIRPTTSSAGVRFFFINDKFLQLNWLSAVQQHYHVEQVPLSTCAPDTSPTLTSEMIRGEDEWTRGQRSRWITWTPGNVTGLTDAPTALQRLMKVIYSVSNLEAYLDDIVDCSPTWTGQVWRDILTECSVSLMNIHPSLFTPNSFFISIPTLQIHIESLQIFPSSWYQHVEMILQHPQIILRKPGSIIYIQRYQPGRRQRSWFIDVLWFMLQVNPVIHYKVMNRLHYSEATLSHIFLSVSLECLKCFSA